MLSQVGNVQAWLALIPTYSKQPKLTALAHTLVLPGVVAVEGHGGGEDDGADDGDEADPD